MSELLLDSIHEWIKERPAWQQEALRRLEARGQLDAADVAELAELCKAARGLAPPSALSTPEFSTGSGASTVGDSGPVGLASVTHVGHVNALVHGQTIQFERLGLTVVYGDNAAGKSGYARILKAACRARGGRAPVLSNVLSERPPGKPSAEIKYTAAESDRAFNWTDGAAPPKELALVSVFDTHAAAVYVGQTTDVAFRPLGLDLLDKLAKACGEVKKVLQAERDALQRARPRLPSLEKDTAAGKLVEGLSALTRDVDIAGLSQLTPEDDERVRVLTAEVTAATVGDPVTRARQLRVRIGRYERLGPHLQRVHDAIDGVVAIELGKLRENVKATAEIAASARAASPTEPLPGVGSDAWKNLWRAARQYSAEHAYADRAFPATETDARCVLCQQTLGRDAIERFERFAAALASTAETEALDAAKALDDAEHSLRALEIEPADAREALEDLATDDTELAGALSAWLRAAAQRLASLLDVRAEEQHLPPLENADHLTALVSGLREQATAAASLADPTSSRAARAELRELQARQSLRDAATDVLSEVDRLRRLAVYEQALKDTATNTVTQRSTELTKEYVTEALAQQFQRELERLDFTRVEIELRAARGTPGALHHQIVFTRPSGVDLAKVVSEGEGRCLALAAFLAELSTAPHPSAIIFDDPVSSLDHVWRDRVARRLAEEAKVRQVIVFSHDIVFLLALLDHAAEVGAPASTRYLRRELDGPGVCDVDLPWPAMKVKERIKVLNRRAQEAVAVHNKLGTVAYEPMARDIYGMLREAWERAVEEILLNGVVERFRKDVQTKRLKELKAISDDDVKAITAGMTKTSAWLRGHDHAAAHNAPVPGPDELKVDIKAFVDWVESKR